MTTPIDLSRHPCFNDKVRHQFGRIHLPVAPICNIQCNFCNRKYDCVNESRPGVTSVVLSPGQAVEYLRLAVARDPRLSVVGIAGPGDPFATPEETIETLRLVREQFPSMITCLATNGLNLRPWVAELAKLAVSHVTVTINAINPAVGANIYPWVRADGKTYRGADGARRLIDQQFPAVAELKKLGVTMKINTILLPGINDSELVPIAERAKALGVDILNCIPVMPVEGAVFENIVPPTPAEVLETRKLLSPYVPLMHHCTRCRADAVGLLGEAMPETATKDLAASAQLPLKPSEVRPYIAVASWDGVLVNQHLGEADELWIWEEKDGIPRILEQRRTPPSGTGNLRWETLAGLLKDCRLLLVSGAGPKPSQILEQSGLKIIQMDGMVTEGIEAAFSNADMTRLQKRWAGCGLGCSGQKQGCG
jgi:nitrogen fixation protein NifB